MSRASETSRCDALLAECAKISERQAKKLEEFQEERRIRETLIETQDMALEQEKDKNKVLQKVTFWESLTLGALLIIKLLPLL